MAISAIVAKPIDCKLTTLSINIKAIDPKLVAILVQNEEILLNQQLDCILMVLVDDHGNIRMPVLGRTQRNGFTLDEIRVKIEKQLLADYFKKEANIFCHVKLAGFKYTINGEIGVRGLKLCSRNMSLLWRPSQMQETSP
jgi:polysaccharide export outer membrane protein